jgi:VWFA-related protein
MLTAAVLGQAPGGPQDKPFQFEVDVELVQLPVSVFDKDGLVIAGLKQENFRVFEDKVQQEISLFRHEDIPLSIGLVIDSSGSMRTKRERVHSAALSFVRESNPEDETFVVAFDSAAYLQQDFTGSIGDLVDALDTLDPRDQTAMYDAIYLSVDKVGQGRMDKKVLLVISDGEDTSSQWGYNKVLDRVRAAKDVTIYAIGLLEENDSRCGGLFGRCPQKKAKEGLTEIAELSGGQAYFPKSVDEVETICRKIARDLRNQYTLGYSPTNKDKDGTVRNIKVEVVNPPKSAGRVSLDFKQQYVAPGGPQQP